jgi:hypothetical protein
MNVPSRELMPVIRAALERGQRVRMTVNGSSMLPFIHDGEVVEIEPIHSLPKMGDIVLLQCSEDRYVVHRVARLEDDTLFLRGDAQLHCEGPFTSDAVLGRVITAWHNDCPRALGRGVWRLAGLVWMRCTPFGLWLLRLAVRIRGIGGRVVRRLKRLSVFRAWAKRVPLSQSQARRQDQVR